MQAEDEQTKERRERAEEDARRKAAIDAEPLDAARARYAEPVPAVEPVRVGQWRVSDDGLYQITAESDDGYSITYAEDGVERHQFDRHELTTDRLLTTTLEVLQAKYGDNDRVTFGECGRGAAYRHAEVDGVRIACTEQSTPENAISAIDAALSRPAPVLTRTEAILAWCADKSRVTWGKKASGDYAPMVDGKYVDNTSWLEACDSHPAAGLSAEAIIARIDAALAKPAPQESTAASLALDEVTKLRRTHAELGAAIERMTTLLGDSPVAEPGKGTVGT